MDQGISSEAEIRKSVKRQVSRGSNWPLILLVGAPVLAVDASLSLILSLPLFDTMLFGACAAGLVVWNLKKRMESAPAAPIQRNSVLIGASLAVSALCFFAAIQLALVFGALAAVALVFAVTSLSFGTRLTRTWVRPLGILFFAVPWVQPTATLLSFPWRALLSNVVATAVKPLVNSVAAQGTSIAADSVKVALAWDAGGFWQIQFFLLASIGLIVGSGWRPVQFAIWFSISLIAAVTAYTGFLVTFLVANLLVKENISQATGMLIELGWWGAAFAGLWFIARWRLKPKTSGHQAVRKPGPRAEEMFPNSNVRNLASVASSATAKG